MLVADIDIVEIQNQKLSELRQWFFERPDRVRLVHDKLPHIIGDLRPLATSGSIQAKKVLGQALHLSSLLSCHRMDYGICLQELNEMIDLARESSDDDMEIAALIQQGMLYSYEFRPSLRHATFRRAMQLETKMSPLLRMRVLFGYAESIAASGQLDERGGVERYLEAERTLDMAESLPIADDDPGSIYVRYNRVTRVTLRARFLVANRQCQEAIELLAGLLSHDATPDTIEVLFVLAQAHSHMLLRRSEEDSFERVCVFVEALVDAAKRMESRLYLAQAQICVELLMLSGWQRECSKRLLPAVACLHLMSVPRDQTEWKEEGIMTSSQIEQSAHTA